MKTVNLRLSQELKEAGYPQDYQTGDWCYEEVGERLMWISEVNEDSVEIIFPWAIPPKDDLKMKKSIFKAPTADEILEKLPENHFDTKGKGRLNFHIRHREGNVYKISLEVTKYGNVIAFHYVEEVSLANAAAKMWLYLNQNGLLK